MVEVLPGSSAQEIGLQIGDIIVEIDGVPVQSLTNQELGRRLQGRARTAVEMVMIVESEAGLVEVPLQLLRTY